MKTRKRVLTPIDFFVQTYAIDHPRDYEYHPGDSVSFEASMMIEEEIIELIKAVNDDGDLSVHFEGRLVVWETPEPDDEEPEKIAEPEKISEEAEDIPEAIDDAEESGIVESVDDDVVIIE